MGKGKQLHMLMDICRHYQMYPCREQCNNICIYKRYTYMYIHIIYIFSICRHDCMYIYIQRYTYMCIDTHNLCTYIYTYIYIYVACSLHCITYIGLGNCVALHCKLPLAYFCFHSKIERQKLMQNTFQENQVMF